MNEFVQSHFSDGRIIIQIVLYELVYRGSRMYPKGQGSRVYPNGWDSRKYKLWTLILFLTHPPHERTLTSQGSRVYPKGWGSWVYPNGRGSR